MDEIITLSVRLIFAIIGLLITTYLVPWLKEKRLYETVKKAVNAYEKLAETGYINKEEKYDKVIEYLESKGVKFTPEISIFIESCVQEIDMLKKEL